MAGLVGDFRLAMRTMGRAPVTAGAAVVSLAIGFGANLTIFTWASALVWRPLPGVARQSELFVVDAVSKGGADIRLSYPEYRELSERSRTLSAIVVHAYQPMSLAVGERAERIWGQIVSANVFEAMGVPVTSGRAFRPAEDRVDAVPVAVISHALWQRRFNGNSRVIGKEILLNGQGFTIIGVAPREFRGVFVGLAMDVWLPASMHDRVVPGGGRFDNRAMRWLGAYARPAAGTSLAAVQHELSAIARQLAAAHSATNDGVDIRAFALWDAPWGTTSLMRPIVVILLGVAAAVLVAACANVTGLLLARALARGRETAVRAALGASRWQLARPLVCESVVIAATSALAGVAAAAWSAGALRSFVPPTTFPVAVDLSVDGLIAGLGALLAALVAAALAIVPATRAGLPASSLKEDTRALVTVRHRTRARRVLVTAQVAVSSALLLLAALCFQALARASRLDPGYQTRDVTLASLDLFSSGYTPERGVIFYRALLERAAALPGVQGASIARRIPFNFGGRGAVAVQIDGYVPARDEDMTMPANHVGPGYFATLQIAMTGGREFTPADDLDTRRVAIVNEAARRRFWRARDPLGSRVRVNGEWATVVGVAADSKYFRLDEPPTPYLYLPVTQFYRGDVILHVRSRAPLDATARALRHIVGSLDPTIALYDVRTMREHMATATFLNRMAATLLALFGSITLLLMGVGIHALVAFDVEQRLPEMALRSALGASAGAIRWLVVRDALGLVAIGCAVGVATGLAASGLAARALPAVSGPDLRTIAAIPALLAGFTLLASAAPVVRAGREQPMRSFV